MILGKENREFSTNIGSVPKSFQIKTTAKAFKILTNNLYSNKIHAIIRELSCNAYDAHVVAKNPEPFIVHLPSTIEPYFSVKDFGTGLSDSDVMNLYTTFFDSNKTDTNELIGALGLGSKSPFAYSDSFSVISRYRKTNRQYTCFLNSSGEPQIMKIAENKTDEPNGLEVSMNVSKDDFSRFVQEARNVFSFFSKKPKIIGVSNLNVPELKSEKSFLHDNWIAFASFPSYDAKSYFIQGNIGYPIPDSPSSKNSLLKMAKGDIKEKLDFVANHSFVITVPIGTFEVTPSREEISLTDDAIKTLLDCIDRVYDDFIVQMSNNRMNLYATDYEKLVEMQRIADRFNDRSLLGMLVSKNTPGYKVTGNGEVIIKIKDMNKFVDSVTVKIKSKKKGILMDKKNYYSRGNPNIYLSLSTSLVFIGKDKKITTNRKIKFHSSESQSSKFLVFSDKDVLEEVLNGLGNPPYTNLDDVILPKKEELKKAGVISSPRMAGKKITFSLANSYPVVEDVMVDLKDLSKIKYYYFKKGRGKNQPFYLRHLSEILEMTGYYNRIDSEFVLYELNSTMATSKKFNRHDNKVELGVFLSCLMAGYMEKNPIIEDIMAMDRFTRELPSPVEYNPSIKNLYDRIPCGSPAKSVLLTYVDYHEEAERLEKEKEKRHNEIKLLRIMGFFKEKEEKVDKLRSRFDFRSLNDIYPLFSIINNYALYDKRSFLALLDYISMVDKSH